MRLLLLILFLMPAMMYGQDSCGCLADLDFLYQRIKRLPSYKKQFKGAKQQEFEALYQSVRKNTPNCADDLTCYIRLSTLLFAIRDNHLGFWQTSDHPLKGENLPDSSLMQAYRQSAAFQQFPRIEMDLDSLQAVLAQKAPAEQEGIYHYGRYLTAGLFRIPDTDSLSAIILESHLPNWGRGQLAFLLYEYTPGSFRAMHTDAVQKIFVLFPQERLSHGTLVPSNWKKETAFTQYVDVADSIPLFTSRLINDSVSYIRLGKFSADEENMALADSFYQTVQSGFTTPYLIADLRNNGGGADKVSKKFRQLLEQYSRHGKLYLLINGRTASNAEQFTIRVRQKTQATVLGEASRGMIAYGSNYGHVVTLPSGRYQFYPTDMNFSNFQSWEDVGVQPDVYLKEERDWMEQTIKYIGQ